MSSAIEPCVRCEHSRTQINKCGKSRRRRTAGLSEEEEREGKDSRALRSRERTGEEDPKMTCGVDGGEPKDWSSVAEERESGEASHVLEGHGSCRSTPGKSRKKAGLSEEEEREDEDSQALRSGQQTGEEDPKTTCGADRGYPKDSSSEAEERESREASHLPGGTWLLQVPQCGLMCQRIRDKTKNVLYMMQGSKRRSGCFGSQEAANIGAKVTRAGERQGHIPGRKSLIPGTWRQSDLCTFWPEGRW
ncbi:hypothetical protein NDU88_005083 [Pleurodeles waltl]|uniref:Uncharacterized protein n=1 Tax=Pleurodeles waltl TaxID=8319 RepID=A0AAV7QDU8_PLEWA|nr:hypothetical protein NDU88_005083 [Pleurodeles waltl]